MSSLMKFLIGLAAVAAMTWIHHGAIGNGERLVNRIEAQARAAAAKTELPGIDVSLGRNPLNRLATLTGNADRFQREGQGELKGLNDIVRDVEGVAGIRWTDEAEKTALPLLVETLIQTLLAFLAGFGIAWLIWRRRAHDTYY